MLKEITSIADLLSGEVAENSTITIAGWVRTRRDSKSGISFVTLHDGSCFAAMQIVAPNSLANYNDEILNLSAGCSLICRGKLVKSPAAGQLYEVQADEIQVCGYVGNPETYPISPKYHTPEYLREYAHLRSRTNVIGAATRISNCLSHAIHQFLYERRFQWIRTPIITSNDAEGGGQQFRVSTLDLLHLPRKENGLVDFGQDYFGVETFLSVSGQLNVESYCEALSRVYTFGPTFRAENSNTARHLAEFWMVEPEIAFADLTDNAKLAEEMLRYLVNAILNERGDDMAFFAELGKNGSASATGSRSGSKYASDSQSRSSKADVISRLEKLATSEFVHMDYSEAIAVLEKATKKFEFPVKWGCDLQSEHERYLTEEYVKAPVVVRNYPKEIKSFYMRLNDDGKTVAAMDILAPGIGEIIGGSQREERFEVLDKRLEDFGVKRELYGWYLDLRRYGTIPHSGFGLGFERFLVYVTGLANIRDVIPFPRTPKHAKF